MYCYISKHRIFISRKKHLSSTHIWVFTFFITSIIIIIHPIIIIIIIVLLVTYYIYLYILLHNRSRIIYTGGRYIYIYIRVGIWSNKKVNIQRGKMY